MSDERGVHYVILRNKRRRVKVSHLSRVHRHLSLLAVNPPPPKLMPSSRVWHLVQAPKRMPTRLITKPH